MAVVLYSRFILIENKDQKIIDAYAPRPSSEEIAGVLDVCLKP
ncbi:MAG: hypothetical protein V8S95_10685 [Odoribacter sp.]